jgi:hypothetical protein
MANCFISYYFWQNLEHPSFTDDECAEHSSLFAYKTAPRNEVQA